MTIDRPNRRISCWTYRPGDNWLTGGAGRDILIGGSGADAVPGGGGKDILIGGATSYANDSTGVIDGASFTAILAEWTATSDYSFRVAHLRNGGGLNGSARLNASTVLGDGAADTLTGSGGRDWFLSFDVLDLTPGRTATGNNREFLNGIA